MFINIIDFKGNKKKLRDISEKVTWYLHKKDGTCNKKWYLQVYIFYYKYHFLCKYHVTFSNISDQLNFFLRLTSSSGRP